MKGEGIVANGDLLNALCPTPEKWKDMKREDFQETVGHCIYYLLQRDQKRIVVNSIASFVGGIIGGITTMGGWLGFKG